jgi:hypothetical protein
MSFTIDQKDIWILLRCELDVEKATEVGAFDRPAELERRRYWTRSCV